VSLPSSVTYCRIPGGIIKALEVFMNEAANELLATCDWGERNFPPWLVRAGIEPLKNGCLAGRNRGDNILSFDMLIIDQDLSDKSLIT